MTFATALTRLEVLTFTGLVSNLGAVDQPPQLPDLPALVTEDVSLPFNESLKAWNIQATTTVLTVFIDHVLLIEGINQGTFETRWANTILYTDRYTAAISADMFLNNTLIEPLQLIVLNRGIVEVRLAEFSGIRFRHHWRIKV